MRDPSLEENTSLFIKWFCCYLGVYLLQPGYILSANTKLDEKIEGADNFRAWKYRISLVLEENELDSYISEEVPDPEGDEAKALHKKKMVMEKRIIVKDHLSHRCPLSRHLKLCLMP